jgi:hypothetical protein
VEVDFSPTAVVGCLGKTGLMALGLVYLATLVNQVRANHLRSGSVGSWVGLFACVLD